MDIFHQPLRNRISEVGILRDALKSFRIPNSQFLQYACTLILQSLLSSAYCLLSSDSSFFAASRASFSISSAMSI
jgi:hypothetical protein